MFSNSHVQSCIRQTSVTTKNIHQELTIKQHHKSVNNGFDSAFFIERF